MFSGLEREEGEDEDEVEDDVVEEDESLEVVGACREDSSAARDTWNRPSLKPPAGDVGAGSPSRENGTGCPPVGIPVKEDWCVTLLTDTVSGLKARLSWASRSSKGCWD